MIREVEARIDLHDIEATASTWLANARSAPRAAVAPSLAPLVSAMPWSSARSCARTQTPCATSSGIVDDAKKRAGL